MSLPFRTVGCELFDTAILGTVRLLVTGCHGAQATAKGSVCRGI